MKTEVQKLGERHANAFLELCLKGSGTCESCGVFGALYAEVGQGTDCRKCFVLNLEEWEHRLHSVSQYVFQDSPHLPAEFSRVYRVVMDSFFSTLRGGDNDGNPHAEEVPYWDCPVCETMAEEWTPFEGCSCWLCRVCNTTNHEGNDDCRSCGTVFCNDCGCIITPTDNPANEWAGNHNPKCFYGGEVGWSC